MAKEAAVELEAGPVTSQTSDIGVMGWGVGSYEPSRAGTATVNLSLDNC